MAGGRGRIAALWQAAWRVARRYAPKSSATAASVIVVLMVAVTVVCWFVHGAGQAASLLYVVPIALSALRFGRRGGLAAAAYGVAAFVVFELVRAGGGVDLAGWVGPIVTMTLMGGLVGHLSDSSARQQAASRTQEARFEELRRAGLAALDVSDSIVQRVAAARWMLEVGKNQEALDALDATVAEGIDKVSGTLPPLWEDPSGDEGDQSLDS